MQFGLNATDTFTSEQPTYWIHSRSGEAFAIVFEYESNNTRRMEIVGWLFHFGAATNLWQLFMFERPES